MLLLSSKTNQNGDKNTLLSFSEGEFHFFSFSFFFWGGGVGGFIFDTQTKFQKNKMKEWYGGSAEGLLLKSLTLVGCKNYWTKCFVKIIHFISQQNNVLCLS